MDWRAYLNERFVSEKEAVSSISDNKNIVFGHASAAPQVFSKELYLQRENYKNLSIYHLIYWGEPYHLRPETKGHFNLKSSFISSLMRDAYKEHRMEFIPVHFHQVERLFHPGMYPVDYAIIQVSEPDNEGFCSLGVSCDYTKSAIDSASIIIAEVNDQMPYVHGPENKIHIRDIDCAIKVSYPPYSLPLSQATEMAETIADYCIPLIEDGSTMQIGIGAVPDLVASKLKDHKNLGIHTELFSDSLLTLCESGAVTGTMKGFHDRKILSTFIMGSDRVYKFVDKNEEVELYPVSYVNNPYIIAKNNKMVSVNGCIEIDLFGQVASESIGANQYSGTGGQLDFVRGAQISKGGKSIITTTSTAKDGTISRIVPCLKAGSTVTTGRNEVDYIATEYGIAQLRGQSLKRRSMMLRDLAHPDFRESLDKEIYNRFGSNNYFI